MPSTACGGGLGGGRAHRLGAAVHREPRFHSAQACGPGSSVVVNRHAWWNVPIGQGNNGGVNASLLPRGAERD